MPDLGPASSFEILLEVGDALAAAVDDLLVYGADEDPAPLYRLEAALDRYQALRRRLG